jgi:hypothetical protein
MRWKSLFRGEKRIITGTIVATAAILLFITFNRFNWKENVVFQWDQNGYYRYLPAAIIYNNVSDFRFSDTLDKNITSTLINISMHYIISPKRAGGLTNIVLA